MHTSIRSFVLIPAFVALMSLSRGVSAEALANITIDQIAADKLGTWTLLAADGSTRTSADLTGDPRRFTAGISDFGQVTFSVMPPAGMTARITVFRGGDQIATTDSRQFSFTVYPNDNYRFIVKYWIAATGTLGVISNPQGIVFRIEAETGRTLRGKTPWSFTQLPVGKYSVYANATETCYSPAPQSVSIENEDRKVVTLSLTCNNAVGEFDTVERVRPSKRTIVERVAAREARRKALHLTN